MNRRKRKLTLWKHNPCCYWCGRVTVIYELERGKKVPDNNATVDHIYSKLDTSGKRRSLEQVTVLSCFKCNGERNSKEQGTHDIEDLRRRSQEHSPTPQSG